MIDEVGDSTLQLYEIVTPVVFDGGGQWTRELTFVHE